MKKSILILAIFFIGIQCFAQTKPDSIAQGQITKEVVEKLTNEELIQLIKDIEYIKSTQNVKFFDDKKEFVIQQFGNRTFIKGLIMILMIFIVFLISIPFYFNLRKTKSFHRMINNFIEHDKEIPNNIVLSVFQKKSDLQRSIILISTGIGISIVLLLLEIGGRIWSIGLIPVIIGIGYYVTSRIEK